jgi:conjugal transfer pilus assembly protein TraV
MTMEQANEKAKLKEESAAKPAAAGLPQLADGNFRTRQLSYPLPPQPNFCNRHNSSVNGGSETGRHAERAASTPGAKRQQSDRAAHCHAGQSDISSPVTLPGNYPRPFRKGRTDVIVDSAVCRCR